MARFKTKLNTRKNFFFLLSSWREMPNAARYVITVLANSNKAYAGSQFI